MGALFASLLFLMATLDGTWSGYQQKSFGSKLRDFYCLSQLSQLALPFLMDCSRENAGINFSETVFPNCQRFGLLTLSDAFQTLCLFTNQLSNSPALECMGGTVVPQDLPYSTATSIMYNMTRNLRSCLYRAPRPPRQ